MRRLKSKPCPLAAVLGDVCDGWCNKWCWEHGAGQMSLITGFKEQPRSLFGQEKGTSWCGANGLSVHIPLPFSLPENTAFGGSGGFDGCCAESPCAKGLLLFHRTGSTGASPLFAAMAQLVTAFWPHDGSGAAARAPSQCPAI